MEVPVEREEVYVERRPVNESETRTEAFVDENDSIHVPLSEERVVVSNKMSLLKKLWSGTESSRY
ncbi:DUF2382 domain-containing protein [Exiguobacterium antarcticum]|uniref:DUF2382 domain-containing protein n=1 Tax=Exiguobacterium antarcticum TaxID=132920 RepID=UPI001F264965|nr:DUF2382 domain-containing protein [Exiguobacterium antarcticum]